MSFYRKSQNRLGKEVVSTKSNKRLISFLEKSNFSFLSTSYIYIFI